MPLFAGTRLGHYDVTALLGEGGMGQVWQATDTQLGRQVALKILPDAFAADPDRLARFTREAQILAKLNHPNIAAIYGIEEAEGTRALVLELVEGPTLADRISKGPIPLDEALPIAKQIAEALEAAHEAGVIHRDLKPANIKVREDGTVKVLDFGLAKALDPTASGAADPANSPTLTAAATQMGVILGTAAYMSPEQARGKPVDKRGDVWAFGCVLFEMLTGTRVFAGEDVTLTLAEVVKSDPGWTALPHDLPATVLRCLRRCLQKDPKQRFRDIGEARIAIDEAAAEPAPIETAAALAPTARSAWRPALVASVLSALATGLLVWLAVGQQPTARPSQRFPIPLPDRAESSVEWHQSMQLTPDGQTIGADPTVDLLIDTPFTEGGPTLSPDRRWIAFHSDRSGQFEVYVDRFPELGFLQRVSTSGGREPLWSPDGQELFYRANTGRRIMSVMVQGGASFSAGAPTQLFEGRYAPSTGGDRPFDILPDGSRFVLVRSVESATDRADVVVVQNWFEELKRLVPTN